MEESMEQEIEQEMDKDKIIVISTYHSVTRIKDYYD